MLESALDLVLPAACVACGRPRRPLCQGCAARLLTEVGLHGPPCDHRPDPCPDGFPPTTVVADLEGILARLVVAYKDEDRLDLTPILGLLLAAGLHRAVGAGPAVLVPVPASPAARRRRGRSVTADLVRAACEVGPGRYEVETRILRLRRTPRDQRDLTARGRGANLRGAMRATGPVDPSVRIVIVDDVVTTGSTVVEAARALRVAGAADVRAVALGGRRRALVVPPRGGLASAHGATGRLVPARATGRRERR